MGRIVAALFLGAALLALLPEAGAAETWTRTRLGNGLDVIVAEDHATPFARIDLVFRAGGLSQQAATAGHFHVLEHLLLEAGGPSSIAAGVGALVPLSWNGETSPESLIFRMKVHAADTAAGIGLWARIPMKEGFTQADVAAAKSVVAAEAGDQLADPAKLYEAAMTKQLFPKYPWRRDPTGSPASVAAADAESLLRLKNAWLVPGNATLVVVGDVDAAAVLATAKTAFASWPAAASPWKTPLPPQPKLGAGRPTWFFLPDPSVPEGLALAEIRYRGPDLATDATSSLAADLWTYLLGVPEGRFGKAMAKALPFLHAPDTLRVTHVSQRDGALLSIYAALDIEKPGLLLSRVRAFKETFRGNEILAMRTDPGYFSAAELDAARACLLADRKAALESVDGRAAEIDFALTSADADWYLDLDTKVAALGLKDVVAVVDNWILRNLEVVALRLNPADYDRESRFLVDGGFDALKPLSAFWWQGR